MRMTRYIRSAARRAMLLPFHVVGQGLSAEVVEQVSEGIIATTPIADGALRFYAPTPLLQERAAAVLLKEPDTIRWIDSLPKDAVLWDIGANIGVFSLYAAARSQCSVLAFEPAAANFHVLARNIELNGLADRIRAYCVALCGKTELGVLNLASNALGSALSQFGEV